MSYNPRDMQKLQQQMVKAQEQMAKAQEKMGEELAAMSVEGSSGGGAVVVTLTGDQRAKAIKLDPETLDPEDVGTLEDLILVALTDALDKVAKVQEEAQQRVISAATGGLKLPPGFGI